MSYPGFPYSEKRDDKFVTQKKEWLFEVTVRKLPQPQSCDKQWEVFYRNCEALAFRREEINCLFYCWDEISVGLVGSSVSCNLICGYLL